MGKYEVKLDTRGVAYGRIAIEQVRWNLNYGRKVTIIIKHNNDQVKQSISISIDMDNRPLC